MTPEDIKRGDPKGMAKWIHDFPLQIEEAVRIGQKADLPPKVSKVRNIVMTGLGGSAIGGDLLRSYVAEETGVPFVVNRHYFLPEFVGKRSLVIVSSYSGNTEETIAAHRDATKRKATVLCITTGGETAKLAKRHRQPLITIPPGLSPRAALGFSFFPLLIALSRLGFIRPKNRDIRETVLLLKKKAGIFADVNSPDKAPLALAQKLHGSLPIIYSTSEHLDAVNLRWRGQIAENAKQLAFGHVLPEMNHNELVGWNVLTELMKKMQVVFLRDKGTHKRVLLREEITKGIISKYAQEVTEVWSEGHSLLARMFSLIHFGDWVSLYLAILNDRDPEPVEVINFLKSELSKV